MLLMLLMFGIVVCADQLAKSIVTARLAEGASTSGGVFGVRLRHVVNRKRPWGSARAVRLMSAAWILLAISASIVVTMIDQPATNIATGALMGGALGNLLDGISRNAVTDFIDLRVWPVFNIADTAIVAGAVMLTWNAFRFVTAG